SAKIAKFQTENADALPDNYETLLNRRTRFTEQLAQMNRDIDLLNGQRERLIQVFEASGEVTASGEPKLSAEEQQLKTLEDQLVQARAIYSDQNPNVRILIARIDQVKSQIAAASEAEDVQPASAENPTRVRNTAMLDLQLSEIDGEINAKKDVIASLEKQLEELVDAIRRTPNNQIALNALEREYGTIQKRYDVVVTRLNTAREGAQIEAERLGQKLVLTEQATKPTRPFSPNRPMMMAGGVGLGVAVGLALIVLLEVLNKSVRRPVELTNALGVAPLAIIPYIEGAGEKFRRRAAVLVIFLAILTAVPAVIYYIHTNVYALDALIDTIIERLRGMGLLST
ncbi:MAG: lipopolysaccharide biosynthesis, partial [Pseudomonadota bacterium]